MERESNPRRRHIDAGSIYSYTKTGVAISSDSAGIMACDVNYAEILDREPRSVLGLDLNDITHPDDINSSSWLLRSAQSEGRAFDIRKRYLLPNGRSRWVENRMVTFNAKDGVVLVMSREIDPPRKALVSGDLRAYIVDMAAQLGEMARQGGLTATAEALDLGALLANEEGGVS